MPPLSPQDMQARSVQNQIPRQQEQILNPNLKPMKPLSHLTPKLRTPQLVTPKPPNPFSCFLLSGLLLSGDPTLDLLTLGELVVDVLDALCGDPGKLFL